MSIIEKFTRAVFCLPPGWEIDPVETPGSGENASTPSTYPLITPEKIAYFDAAAPLCEESPGEREEIRSSFDAWKSEPASRPTITTLPPKRIGDHMTESTTDSTNSDNHVHVTVSIRHGKNGAEFTRSIDMGDSLDAIGTKGGDLVHAVQAFIHGYVVRACSKHSDAPASTTHAS